MAHREPFISSTSTSRIAAFPVTRLECMCGARGIPRPQELRESLPQISAEQSSWQSYNLLEKRLLLFVTGALAPLFRLRDIFKS